MAQTNPQLTAPVMSLLTKQRCKCWGGGGGGGGMEPNQKKMGWGGAGGSLSKDLKFPGLKIMFSFTI